MIDINEQGMIEAFSPASEKIFGYSAHEVIGQPIGMLMPGLHSNIHDRYFSGNREKGALDTASVVNEFEAVHKNGSVFPIEIAITEIQMKEKILYTAAICDISERKKAEENRRRLEEELRISQKRLELVINGTIDGIWDWPDSTKDEVYWSPRWKALLGYRDDEISGSKTLLRELLHPDDRASCAEAIRACLEEGKLFDIEYRLKKKSGEYGWFHGKGTTLEEGGITRMSGSISDISVRKASEEKLRESEAKFRIVTNNAPSMLFMADTAKACTFLNKRWSDFTGLPVEQELGYGWKQSIHPDDMPSLMGIYDDAFDKRVPFETEFRLKHHSGEYRQILARSTPHFCENGKFAGYVGSCVDISERKFAETVRNRLVSKLTAANEQLEQFAYVASHDLREPLRIVVGFSDLLSKDYGDRMNDEGREYMAIMRKAAKKMEAMVADLLDYGRLGHDNERLSLIDCNNKLEQAKEALSESIRSTRAVIEGDRLPKVMANPLRFSRLLQNLIGNAIKYQRAGNPPLIYVSAENKKDHWQFAVKDNGIGIKPEYLDSIFAPFKRLHSDHEYAGTGIGLAICRRIVESFGGIIWVESESGNGSTFFFTIPKREPDPNVPSEKSRTWECT